MGVIVRQKLKGKGNPWWVFISHHGRRKSRLVGDKVAAETAASQIRAQLQLGLYQFEEVRKPIMPLFKDYAEKFMLTYSARNHSPSTQRGYRDSLDLYMLPCFGNKPLDQIKRADVKDFIHSLHSKGLKPGTVRNHKAFLGAILAEAMDDEIIQTNPTKQTAKHIQNGDKEEVDFLTWEESVKYLDTAKAHFPGEYAMCLTLLRTGMRLGEVITLQPGDLDFNGRFIVVQRGHYGNLITSTKTKKVRRVDMSSQLAEVLKAHLVETKKLTLRKGWREPPEWLFYTVTGKRVDDSHWRKSVHKKILEKAGIRHIKIHALRHTYASLRLGKGDNILDVSKQLGHASVKMTLDVYAHCIPGKSQKEVDGLDSRTAPVSSASQGIEEQNG